MHLWLIKHAAIERTRWHQKHTNRSSPQDDHILARLNLASPAGVDSYREWLTHGTLLKGDTFWQLEAELCRVIYELQDRAHGLSPHLSMLTTNMQQSSRCLGQGMSLGKCRPDYM